MDGSDGYGDGLPDICGSEWLVDEAIRAAGGDRPVFVPEGAVGGRSFGDTRSAFAVALHMHQPLIPAGGGDLRGAALVSNLQHMLSSHDTEDQHNAAVFRWCYRRMAELVPQLVDEGAQPRVMLDYSGTLLCGLERMGAHDVLDGLRRITTDSPYRDAVEWLGCPWGARSPRPPRCRTTGCTSARGSTISPRCSGCRRWGGSRGSPRPRWRCPITPTWHTSSSNRLRLPLGAGAGGLGHPNGWRR